jgi:hypothetical protein
LGRPRRRRLVLSAGVRLDALTVRGLRPLVSLLARRRASAGRRVLDGPVRPVLADAGTAMRVRGNRAMARAAVGAATHCAGRDGCAGHPKQDGQSQQGELVPGPGEADPVPACRRTGCHCGHGLRGLRTRTTCLAGWRAGRSCLGGLGPRATSPGQALLQLAGAYVAVVELLQGVPLLRRKAFAQLIFHTRQLPRPRRLFPANVPRKRVPSWANVRLEGPAGRSYAPGSGVVPGRQPPALLLYSVWL